MSAIHQLLSSFGGLTGPADPYWSNVVSLHNFPGADGSVVFPDEKGKSWTVSGPQIDTSLGYNAGLFDGSNDHLLSATHADWAMGTGDFTVEAWVRPTSVSGDRNVFGVNVSGGMSFGLTGGKVFCGPTGVSYGPIGATTLSINTLYHVAACKASGTMRVFVNGAVDASAADSRNYAQAAVMIGANKIPPAETVGFLAGWIKAMRLTKGVARYTSGFTPEASPWPTH